MKASWKARLTVLAVAAAALGGGVTAQAAAQPHVLLVCNGTAGCPTSGGQKVYATLQEAVDHSVNGDWVLVWPGRYKGATQVKQGHGLTSGLHIRGMQRNGVVLDGKGIDGSGLHVLGVNNTWVQNMTAENYLTGSANGFYWTGVDGYWGTHLTAYNNGDYGLYAYDSTSSGSTPSAFAYDYGSWNADSGLYIGGCRDCNAVITNSKAEKNALGYSGTNAGGELYIMNSEWAHNATGLLPNSLTSEPDLPQSGANFINNYIHDNNDADIPGAGITAIAPVGVGLGIAGGSENIVRGNRIENQKHAGVLVNWLFMPPINNQIVRNTFKNVGTSGTPGDADIAIDATSIQNCVFGNVNITNGTQPAKTDPPGVADLNDCSSANPGRQNGKGIYEPGDPVVTVMTALNAAGITEPKAYKGPGPHPEAQLSMANPCEGVPANPWCRGGKPVIAPPAKAPKG